MTLPIHDAGQRALRGYIEAIENLTVTKKDISDEIAEKFAEAEALLDTYLHAVESFETTPIGEYLKEAAE